MRLVGAFAVAFRPQPPKAASMDPSAARSPARARSTFASLLGAAAGRAGIRARICALRLGIQPALAGIKHLNRLENVLARREWDGPEIAEGILLDRDGNVIGGTMTNLFMVENGALVTPELVRCGVAGVTRERIIGHAAASGMACRPEDVTTERLLAADELFVTNSIIGVWQIRELGDRAWKTGAVTQRIKRWLDEESD